MNDSVSRAKIIFIVTIILFSILLGRVLYLQYGDNASLKERAERNKVRKILIEPERGNIYDRNGTLIVDNRHDYNLYAVPEQLLTSEESISFLSSVMDISSDSLITLLTTEGVKKNNLLKLRRSIGVDMFSKIEENSSELYGVRIKKEWRRNFVKHTAPHILGYLGEVKNPSETNSNIRLGDLKGKEGAEYVYDNVLRGENGYKLEIRDVKNNRISDYNPEEWKPAERGRDLFLTIDYELQSYIEELLEGKSAACVVLDINSGEILSMVSKPDYPLEIFSRSLTQDEWDGWLNAPGKPLYNKCILGEYPPGSVLKMGNVIAAFNQKVMNKKTDVFCPGGMKIGNRFIKCWLHSGHGTVTARSAVAMSCDTYFYEMAKRINVDIWSDFLKMTGLGIKTGIDTKFEKQGNVPDINYYKERNIRGNLTGRFANLMIGQGEILTTPLQIAAYTSVLAGKGVKRTPHLFRMGVNEARTDTIYYQSDSPDTLDLNRSYLNTALEGMYDVVNSSWGTAKRAKSSKMVIAGKTGTAQNAHGDDHAWFTSYAPYDDPKIVVTIFEEFGLHGSSLGPVAKKIYEKWYELK